MSNVIEDLSAPRKRARIHDAQIVIKLPKRAKELVEGIAAKEQTDSSVIVRLALAEYFERRGYRA